MEKIKNFKAGNNYEGIFILRNLSFPEDKNGKEYTKCTLSDATGEITVRQWVKNTSVSSPCFVRAKLIITEWNGAISATASELVIVDVDEETKSSLVPTSYLPAAEMINELNEIIDSVSDEQMRKLLRHAMNVSKGYYDIPAARGMHHNEIHGLLQHSLEMAKNAIAIAPSYPVLNRDLLVTGTILHDIAKLEEFNVDNIGMVESYSIDGNLFGHLYMGAKKIDSWCAELSLPSELSRCLQHMILAHHGQRDWGAVQLPTIPEAQALFLLDMMSSRMEMYRKEYESLQRGEIASETNKGLGVKVYKSLYAPEEVSNNA